MDIHIRASQGLAAPADRCAWASTRSAFAAKEKHAGSWRRSRPGCKPRTRCPPGSVWPA